VNNPDPKLFNASSVVPGRQSVRPVHGFEVAVYVHANKTKELVFLVFISKLARRFRRYFSKRNAKDSALI